MRLPRSLIVAIAASSTALVCLAAGCGSSGDAGSQSNPDAGHGGTIGVGGTGTGVGGGVIPMDSGPNGDSTVLPEDAACASETVQSALQPLAMYVLLDRSQSMTQNNKWQDASSAFSQFVNDPQAAGIKVALSFFPDSGGKCDGSGFSTPVVPMGVLPANADPITSSLQAHQPGSGSGSGTPMEGALRGLSIFCSAYAQGNPAEKTVGVLITDGNPNGCDEDTNDLAGIAAGAFSGTPSVPIFAIGMEGADFGFLDQIAASGGSTKSYDVSQGGAQAFLAALLEIAGQALPCEFPMPTSQTQTVDPTKVNVKYTDQNSAEQLLGQVAGASACVPNAWYYDDPKNPTKLILCPDTCTAVRAQASGKIDVVLGCSTVVAPPA